MDLSEMSGCNNNDLLICGCCKRNFNLNNIVGFIKHKKFDCEDPGISADPKSKTLLCQSCHQKFLSPWSLLKHAQNVHFLQIYLENEYRLGRQAVTIHEECSVDTEWPLSQFSDHGTKSVLPESDNHVHENDAFSSAPEISGDGPNSSVVEPNQTSIEKSSLKSTQNNNEVFTAEKKNNPEKMNAVCDGSDTPVRSPVKSPVVSAADVSTPVLGSPGLLRSTSEIATQTKSRPGSASDAEQSTGSIKGLEKQVSSSKSENCCDSQDCGITVMPGTHESLKKCCSAVVPKKRKRHMEIKHKPGLLSRFRRRDKPRTSSPSIYIDMTPCAPADSTRGTRKSGAGSNTGAFPSAREKSVIIQPGSTFSIPVSYPIKGLGQAVDISGLNIKPVSFSLIPPNQNNSVSFGKASATATVTSSSDSLQNELSNRTQFAATQIATLPSMAHSSQDKSTSNFQMAEIDHNLINQILREQLENPPLISSKTGSTSSGALGPLVIDMERGNAMDISVPEVDIDLAQDGDERFSGVIDDARSPGGKKRRYPTSRPYKCDQCDDAFNQRVHLKKHQSKHTGIKPFKCDQCDYATVERSHLKVHIRVHTGEKPFKCTYCEYATAQNSTLKIHLKRHHGTNCRNFPCDSCGKEFRQKQMLDVHAAQEHITGTVGVENMEILQSSPVEQDLSAGTSNVATVVTPGELSQKTPSSESIDNKQASSESSTSDNGFHTISLISKDANLSKSDERETSPDSLEK